MLNRFLLAESHIPSSISRNGGHWMSVKWWPILDVIFNKSYEDPVTSQVSTWVRADTTCLFILSWQKARSRQLTTMFFFSLVASTRCSSSWWHLLSPLIILLLSLQCIQFYLQWGEDQMCYITVLVQCSSFPSFFQATSFYSLTPWQWFRLLCLLCFLLKVLSLLLMEHFILPNN